MALDAQTSSFRTSSKEKKVGKSRSFPYPVSVDTRATTLQLRTQAPVHQQTTNHFLKEFGEQQHGAAQHRIPSALMPLAIGEPPCDCRRCHPLRPERLNSGNKGGRIIAPWARSNVVEELGQLLAAQTEQHMTQADGEQNIDMMMDCATETAERSLRSACSQSQSSGSREEGQRQSLLCVGPSANFPFCLARSARKC